MLFRDLVLVSRFPQTTRESLRATSHLDETSPFIIHRHSGCTDFDDCAGSTGCATAGDHLNNSNVLLLENWHRRNWIDGCHVDLAAKSSYCSRPSATSHQASEPLHDNTSGVVSRYVRNILVGAICNGRQVGRAARTLGASGTASQPFSSMSKNMETAAETVRGVLQGTPPWCQPSLSGPGNLGWSLDTASGEVFVSSNHQGRGETPETDWLNRKAESRRLERCRLR